MAGVVLERNQDATVYCGNVDDKVLEPLLWELFLQAGPVVNVHMPKDRITQNHQGYGFIEFMSEEDADYSIKILNMIKVYGKPLRVNKASAHNKNLDVGANIFIGNLDPDIDEKLLYDTFSAFGVILTTPKIMRDPETGNSKGFAFINFASFESSDAAIDAMNGQYLSNRPISVSYSFKKDTKGERHGSAAERLLAANNPLTQTDRPHQFFADAPPIIQHNIPETNIVGLPPAMQPTIIPPPMGDSGGDQTMHYVPAHGLSSPAFMSGPPPPNMHGLPPPPPIAFPPSLPPPSFMQMPPLNIPPVTSAVNQHRIPPPMDVMLHVQRLPHTMFRPSNERHSWTLGPTGGPPLPPMGFTRMMRGMPPQPPIPPPPPR